MPAGSKQPVVVHYLEHIPADVGAAFIWLKNRDPEHWRDVQNVEHVLGKYIISDHPNRVDVATKRDENSHIAAVRGSRVGLVSAKEST